MFERRLVWVGRDGGVTQIGAPPNAYTDPVISPDGHLVALSVQGTTQTLWVYDLARSTLRTLPAPASLQSPVWTSDGHRLVYRATRAGFRNMYSRSADGSGEEERLTMNDWMETPSSISRDGRFLLFTRIAPDSGHDLFVMRLDHTQQEAQAIVKTRFSESSPHFSRVHSPFVVIYCQQGA